MNDMKIREILLIIYSIGVIDTSTASIVSIRLPCEKDPSCYKLNKVPLVAAL